MSAKCNISQSEWRNMAHLSKDHSRLKAKVQSVCDLLTAGQTGKVLWDAIEELRVQLLSEPSP